MEASPRDLNQQLFTLVVDPVWRCVGQSYWRRGGFWYAEQALSNFGLVIDFAFRRRVVVWLDNPAK